MSCPHDNPRGRCEICRVENMEDRFGVVDPEDVERFRRGADDD